MDGRPYAYGEWVGYMLDAEGYGREWWKDGDDGLNPYEDGNGEDDANEAGENDAPRGIFIPDEAKRSERSGDEDADDDPEKGEDP